MHGIPLAQPPVVPHPLEGERAGHDKRARLTEDEIAGARITAGRDPLAAVGDVVGARTNRKLGARCDIECIARTHIQAPPGRQLLSVCRIHILRRGLDDPSIERQSMDGRHIRLETEIALPAGHSDGRVPPASDSSQLKPPSTRRPCIGSPNQLSSAPGLRWYWTIW